MLLELSSTLYGPSQANKVPLNMSNMHRFRSFYVCAKYYPGFCSLFIHSVVSCDSVSGQ